MAEFEGPAARPGDDRFDAAFEAGHGMREEGAQGPSAEWLSRGRMAYHAWLARPPVLGFERRILGRMDGREIIARLMGNPPRPWAEYGFRDEQYRQLDTWRPMASIAEYGFAKSAIASSSTSSSSAMACSASAMASSASPTAAEDDEAYKDLFE